MRMFFILLKFLILSKEVVRLLWKENISKYPVDEAVLCAAINKASVWSYENEWRMVYVMLTPDSKNPRMSVDVSVQPSAIYLGYHFLKTFL